MVTIVFPNPEWDKTDNQYQRLNSSLSFSTLIPSGHITTLSSSNAAPAQAITGLLYVPDLPPNDPCIAIGAPFVPANVTRQANLPEADYELVALAPWLSQNCTLKYLASARQDPIGAFIFFWPDNSTTTPSDESGSVWNLGDGDKWKHQNDYPVYAISGADGQTLMQASASYSSNMTDVPHGSVLTNYYDSRDYVRLYSVIDTAGSSTLPSLWIFLLVVLGILLGIIGLTSLSMHYLQRRRRNALRRRVASGEVDLEALGIKRLTVPQDILDQFPLYTYGSGVPLPPSAAYIRTPGAAEDKVEEEPPAPYTSNHRPTPLQQPTCAICLEDFVPASTDPNDSSTSTEGTMVRELPCQHIFHPECVDTFLRDSSSLCPMCKKTALPKGYCPRVVTNAMVRRERMVRSLRPQVTVEDDDVDTELGRYARGRRISRSFSTFGSFGLPTVRGGRRTSGMGARQSQQLGEMSSPTSQAAVSENGAPATADAPPVQPPATQQRREWARQRAVAMLGRQRAPVDPDAEDAQTTPGWRKVLRGMFPGVGR